MSLKTQNYAVLDRAILCICRLDINMNFILRDLNSCPNNITTPPIYKINMGMFNRLQEHFPNYTRGIREEFTEKEQEFPFVLPKTDASQAGIDLEVYLHNMEQILINDHQKGHEVELFTEDELMLIGNSTILGIVTSIFTVIIVVGLTAIACRQCKIKTMIYSVAPSMIPMGEAAEIAMKTVNCETTIFTYITMILTCIGLLIYFGKYLVKLTWLKGELCTNNCSLYLEMKTGNRRVRLKLCKLIGHDVLYTYTGYPDKIDLTVNKNFLGDIMKIDWNGYELWKQKVTKYPLTSAMECPFSQKLTIRRMMKDPLVETQIIIKQDDTFTAIREKTERFSYRQRKAELGGEECSILEPRE